MAGWGVVILMSFLIVGTVRRCDGSAKKEQEREQECEMSCRPNTGDRRGDICVCDLTEKVIE